nr:trigger factor [Clostridiales bacterium]
EKAMQKAYMQQKNSISIPGFRKGKVPRQMVEKMYGPGIFYEDAANIVLPDAYEEGAKESGLDITSSPEIEVTQVEKGKPFIFTALVALRPEVKLGNYKGLEVPRNDVSVSDEELEKELRKEQEKNGRQITIDDEAAQNGDTVTMDYKGTIDGEAFEGGSAQGANLTLGSGTFIPGFEEQLVGVKAGETKEVHVTFPEDYHAEELKGKEAVFTCNVIKISRTELPELNDEFAQDVSEFDTIDEYKEDLRKQLQQRKENAAKQSRRDNALSRAARAAKIEIPAPMLETRAVDMVNNFARQLAAQGMNLEQYMQYTGSNAEMMREQVKPQAEIQIRNELVLDEIAKAEGIEVTEEEILAEVEEMAKSYGIDADKMKEVMTDEERENFRKDLAARKALDLIADAAVEVDEPEEPAEENGEE